MDGYWILNAPGHRLAELDSLVVAIAETTLSAPDMEQIVVDPGEDWICDSCNGAVEVFQPDGHGGPDPTRLPPQGSLRPVPVLHGLVLCTSCFLQQMGGDLTPAKAWGGCGCPPCQAADGR